MARKSKKDVIKALKICLPGDRKRENDLLRRMGEKVNLVELHITEIHSVKDVTNEFIGRCGHTPDEPFLQVDLTYDCYGQLKRTTECFWKSNWDKIQKQGYFFGNI